MTVVCRIWENWYYSRPRFWWQVKCAAARPNSPTAPPKVKPSHSMKLTVPLIGITHENRTHESQKSSYTNHPSSIIHTSKKQKPKCPSLMNGESMVYPLNKDQNYWAMPRYKSWKCYAKEQKPVTEDHILYDYMKYADKAGLESSSRSVTTQGWGMWEQMGSDC